MDQNAAVRAAQMGKYGQSYPNLPTAPVQQADPNIGKIRDAGGLGSYNPTRPEAQANTDLALQHMNDPSSLGYLSDVAKRRIFETGGSVHLADPTMYFLGGDPNYAQNQATRFNNMGTAFGNRGIQGLNRGPADQYGSTIAGSGWAQGAAAQNLMGLGGTMQGIGGQALGVAGGPAVAGQMNAANALYGMGQMPAGPSVAELAMQQQAANSMQQQQAMAAGARGGNAALAMQNAAANQANIGGQLTQQLGVQRASEDMANRQFAANALGAAGQAYGNAAGTQLGAYGQAGSLYGAGGQAYGAAGQLYGNIGNQALTGQANEFNFANQDAAQRFAQQQQNDAQQLAYYKMALGLTEDQAQAMMAYDQQRTGNDLALYGIQKNAPVRPDMGLALLGAGLQTAGTIGGAMIGGPAGAAGGATLGGAANSAINSGNGGGYTVPAFGGRK